MQINRYNIKKAIFVFAILLGLIGCASNKSANVDSIIVTPNVDSLKELKRVSIEARNELRLLAKAQQSRTEKTATPEQHRQAFFQATYTPPGFEKEVDFHYVGEVEKAVEAISMVSGYRLLDPDGRKPSDNIWVNISFENKPLNEALKEVGMQTGDKIRLEIHPSAKIMRLIYK